jgi:hypothetical protein
MFMTASNQRYVSFVALLLGILMAWKYVFSVFPRTSAQGYVTTGGPYWNFSCRENAGAVEFRCSELKGIRLPVETFIEFCRTKNEITLGHEAIDPKVISIHKASVRPLVS